MMRSENIWFSWSKPPNYREKSRCHTCDTRRRRKVEPKMAKIGQCSGRPETAKKQFFKPLHASLATRCNMATFMSFQRRFFSSSIFFLSLVLSHFAFHPEFSFLTISGTKLSDEGDQTMKGGRQGQARDWQKKSEK